MLFLLSPWCGRDISPGLSLCDAWTAAPPAHRHGLCPPGSEHWGRACSQHTATDWDTGKTSSDSASAPAAAAVTAPQGSVAAEHAGHSLTSTKPPRAHRAVQPDRAPAPRETLWNLSSAAAPVYRHAWCEPRPPRLSAPSFISLGNVALPLFQFYTLLEAEHSTFETQL